MGIRCVFLVPDGISLDVPLAYMLFHLRLVKESVAGLKEYLKSPAVERLHTRRLSLAPIMDTARARYSGPSRKLVVALDIGTTFSGAAYAFLDPGQVPQIRSVTRRVFPLILDLLTNGNDKTQVPEQSESWVCKSSLYIVLR